ncbi:MAG: LysM peptidoglycan-binding domain-containing M23 family metallopeptidase [bacterium]|nr:LysM peptidoglycan-binding domain-containing M23 family metallopeptidase [bacterium]
MVAIAAQGRMASSSHQSSLLHAYLSGEEISEGPLDPSAYAKTDSPGTGGSRIAVVEASDANFITFDDAEVQFAQTLEGNAVVAPLQPVLSDGSDTERQKGPVINVASKPFIHTVEDGETIAGIASKFGISTNTILWTNGLSGNDVIKVGDHLTILPTTGVLHKVASGETVLEIAGEYNAKASEIIAYNNLGENAALSIGQKLIIPEGYIAPREAPRTVSQNTRTARDSDKDEPTPPPADTGKSGKGLVWPTTTRQLSQGYRGGHTGIDIPNRSRPPIFAAQSGTVEFTGWLGGYGNLIIVNHGGGLTTYYAHLDKFYVAAGQKVSKGAAIGKMGSTGRSTGPHLHFEVRRGGRPINPVGMY